MNGQPHPHVLDWYNRGFRPGTIDLSPSAPEGADTPAGEFGEFGHYAPPGGISEIREAISALYPGASPAGVVVTNGASEALAAAAFAFVQPGKPVRLDRGVYPSFAEVADRLGAEIVHGSEPELAAELLVVNNPSVPDGKLKNLGPLLVRASAAGVRVIADEVYLDLRPSAPALPAAALSPTAISIGDLSKPLGLGGLRIGWAATHDLEAAGRIARGVQLLSGGPSTVAMAAAATAVRGYADRLARNQSLAAANASTVFAELGAAGWAFEPPQAGWTFVAHPPKPLSPAAVQAISDAGYLLLPAQAFGLGGGYRLSLFTPPEHLRRALRIAATGPRKRGAVVILAKAPQAGVSKTRLAAQLGPERTSLLAEAFLADTVALTRSTQWDVVIAYAPAHVAAYFKGAFPGVDFAPQADGDLGVRIASSLEGALVDRPFALLVGSDTPHLPPQTLADAAAALRDNDAVIGPARDGGFYLLGLSLPAFPDGLFDGVEWSTPSVFETVVANAARLGITLAHLAPVTDIDDEESLAEAAQDIEHSPFARHTRAALAAFREAVLA